MKLFSRMSLHQDEEYLITNHPMVEVSVESDQVGFEAAVGKNGNEIHSCSNHSNLEMEAEF